MAGPARSKLDINVADAAFLILCQSAPDGTQFVASYSIGRDCTILVGRRKNHLHSSRRSYKKTQSFYHDRETNDAATLVPSTFVTGVCEIGQG